MLLILWYDFLNVLGNENKKNLLTGGRLILSICCEIVIWVLFGENSRPLFKIFVEKNMEKIRLEKTDNLINYYRNVNNAHIIINS